MKEQVYDDGTVTRVRGIGRYLETGSGGDMRPDDGMVQGRSLETVAGINICPRSDQYTYYAAMSPESGRMKRPQSVLIGDLGICTLVQKRLH